MTSTTLAERVHELAAADATLMAALTGGIYLVDAPTGSALTAGKYLHPINPDDTPLAYGTLAGTSGDNAVKQLKPCGMVRSGAITPRGRRAKRRYIVVELFDKHGFGSLITAADRLRALFDAAAVVVDGKSYWVTFFAELPTEEDKDIITGAGKRPASRAVVTFSALGGPA